MGKKVYRAKYEMYDLLREKICGFEGKVIGIIFYDTGCTHYVIAPEKLKPDGEPQEAQWYDEMRLELVKAEKPTKAKKPTGGPGPTQMETNQLWLIAQIDEIHFNLCKGQMGTWQERAKQAVAKSKEIANDK